MNSVSESTPPTSLPHHTGPTKSKDSQTLYARLMWEFRILPFPAASTEVIVDPFGRKRLLSGALLVRFSLDNLFTLN